MGRLADKNILITGGNSGIGLAAAQEFGREGARVAICGLNERSLQAAKETLGAGSLAVRADIDNGLEGSPHSRERGEPGRHRHARSGRRDGVLENGPATRADNCRQLRHHSSCGASVSISPCGLCQDGEMPCTPKTEP